MSLHKISTPFVFMTSTTTTTTKIFCATCQQSMGQFKCEGCRQSFCMKHVIEHRQMLNKQLDDIILENDTLRQSIHRNPHDSQSPLTYINQWEQTSIDKIRQIAQDARRELQQLENIHNGTIN